MPWPYDDLANNWKMPTSANEDQRFSGFPWKVFTPGSLIKGGRRSTSADDQFFKVPESLVRGANVAVVYEGAAMLLPHDTPPAYRDAESFKNPKPYNYYRWSPISYYHNGRWMPLTEYVRAVMPHHVEPTPESPAAKTKEYWENRRRLAQEPTGAGTDYFCTCGRRHTQTVYKDLGDQPWKYCPDGGLMTRVLSASPIVGPIKYVCTCGKNHTRTTVPSQKPDRCPDGGEMVAVEVAQ